jgi:hypothetical protein
MNSTASSLLANSSLQVDENKKMELMIGSLSFCVGLSGVIRPSAPMKLDPSTSKIKIVRMTGSSVGSSSEVNSPISFAIAEDIGEKNRRTRQNHGKTRHRRNHGPIISSQKDFITQTGGVSGNIQQLCVIITEAAEENDHTDNRAIDAQVDKSGSNSKKEKEKIHVFTGEWRIIMSAINHGIEVPANSTR